MPVGQLNDEHARIDFGPGYRIYFGKDGDVLVILLGGTKNGQHARWKDYRQRKSQEKRGWL